MRATRFGFGLALLCAALAASAADRGGGHFRKGEVRIEVKHVIAVAVDEEPDPSAARTYVYLSDVPMDAGKVAAAFQATTAAEQQLGEASAGYVRVCIDTDGSECGLYFSHNNPNASFNSSGYGEFKLEAAPGGRVAGRWVLAEPGDFFGETYDFDLRFDVAVTPPPGTPLPADGGEPGKAYHAWVAAVAKGDLGVLRTLVGDDYNAWRLKSEDQDDARAALKDLRDGTPVQARILRGRLDGDAAVLWVEGRDRDEILRRGRVLLRQVDGGWRYLQSSLESVDE
ncbi:MAG: nuclear transport factor 2 family protein [Thermomonas sp.]|nr:nuclear transport factor 2 family protein [Thermomonas sp.]